MKDFEERDIFIDNIPCFKEFNLPIDSLKDFGIESQSIRLILPIIKNLPLSTYSQFLFTSNGSSKSDADYYYNLIQIHLALGSITSLKSGKNAYWNQSFMMFRSSTLLYKKMFNTALKDLSTKRSINKENTSYSDNEKNDFIEKTKVKISRGLDTMPDEDFKNTLRKAIYDKLDPVELTPTGFESYKADIINRIKDFSKHYTSNLKNNKNDKEILSELKKVLKHEYSDEIRTPELQLIVSKVDLILSSVKWHESDTGATIFFNPLIKYPNFYDEISAILEELKEVLFKFQVSKIAGLKDKVNHWLEMISFFQSEHELADQSLIWIKNEFSKKTNALKKISLEGKFYYNRLISLFCKKSLVLLQQNENLSKYETRLFISMNMAHRFCDYHIVALEPIFFNYLLFNQPGALTFLLAQIYRIDADIKDYFYSDLIKWLKFFPIWKELVRDEDLESKRGRRKSQKEYSLSSNSIDNTEKEDELSELTETNNSLENESQSISELFEPDENNKPVEDNEEWDENNNDNEDLDILNKELIVSADENLEVSKKEQLDIMIEILRKYGKPIHIEVFSYLSTNKNLSLFARKKGKTRQYYFKIKKRAVEIIKDNYYKL